MQESILLHVVLCPSRVECVLQRDGRAKAEEKNCPVAQGCRIDAGFVRVGDLGYLHRFTLRDLLDQHLLHLS